MRLDKEIINAEAIARMIDAGDDLQLLVDNIEGETQLFECLDAIHMSMLEDDAGIEGIEVVIGKLKARQVAAVARQQKKRDAIFKALTRLNIPSVKRPSATFSIRKGVEKLEIVNEADIPTQFYKPNPILQRAALTKALKEGETVPGATLVIGPQTLSIRV